MNLPVVIIIAESCIIRKGLIQIVGEIREFEYKETDNPLKLQRLEDGSDSSLIILSENLFHDQFPVRSFIDQHRELLAKMVLLRFPGKKNDAVYDIETMNLGDSEQEIVSICRKILKKNLSERLPAENSEVSKREKEIIRAVALGLTSKEISEMLFISVHTVITHRKNINRKLGIKTVSGLTVYAILNNIITTDEIE